MATKRDDIVDAAARLIKQQGVHAASISGIIAASHASAGSIYHHFANKNEIVLAVARSRLAEPFRAAVLQPVSGTLSPADIFGAIVGVVRAGIVEPALIVQLWAGSSREPELRGILREQFEDARVAMCAHIEDWLVGRGVPDVAGRAEAVARVTLGQAMGFLAQSTLDPDFDKDAYVAEATRLLDGIADSDRYGPELFVPEVTTPQTPSDGFSRPRSTQGL